MVLIMSDIHGNYEALSEVMKKADEMGVSDIYCLGDIVGYYCQVNECCDELRKRKVKCVLGNHDWYMVSGTKCERSRSVNDCLAYQRKMIRKDHLDWLASLPVIRYEKGISMVHGGWLNPIDEYMDLKETYFEEIEGNVFASGHSHVQQVKRFQEKLYCNPGSVGQPRDGDSRAAFAIYDGKTFELCRAAYDIENVCKKMKEAGFDAYYYGCLRDASSRLHA